MSLSVNEIAPDVFRLCVYVSDFNLQFSSFLVRDDEPLLFHTGMRQFFPYLKEGVERLTDLRKLRWISWSHFESDECGALNDWLSVAPDAEPVCSMVGALVNLNDFSQRPPRFLQPGETFSTGRHTYRYIATPQLPHGWDAGVMFDQTDKTLFCSDLFHQTNECEPLTTGDIVSRARQVLVEYESTPFANYVPYTHRTGPMMEGLAALKPETLAIMHGSSYRGNCEQAIRDLAVVFKEVLGGPNANALAA